MMKVFITVLLLQSFIFAECSSKEFLINLLNSNSKWLLDSSKTNTKYSAIEEFFIDKDGTVWVRTFKSDPFPVGVSIEPQLHTNKKGINLLGVMYRLDTSEYEKHFKKYKEKKFLLNPFDNTCSLERIILEITIEDYPDNRKKEILVLKRQVKNCHVSSPQ